MQKSLLSFIFICLVHSLFAQPYKTIKQYTPYKWMVNVSWNVIDDDGRPYTNMFDVANTWQTEYYPNKISVDRYLKNGWSVEAAASFAQYKAGKLINGNFGNAGIFAALDVNAKYSLYQLYAPRMRWVEPYTIMGLGYTFRSIGSTAPHTPVLNLGAGVNFWFTKNIGIQIQSTGKLSIYPFFIGSDGNYFQHSAGISYRWNESKRNKSDFDKKRYPWTRDNKRYKSKGGH